MKVAETSADTGQTFGVENRNKSNPITNNGNSGCSI